MVRIPEREQYGVKQKRSAETHLAPAVPGRNTRNVAERPLECFDTIP